MTLAVTAPGLPRRVPRRRRLPLAFAVLSLAALAASAGCAAGGATETVAVDSPAPAANALAQRLAEIDAAVTAWSGAADIAEAHRAAEAARNLVVGPAGPGYGDADGDGTVAGAREAGLLPGLAGESGLATTAAGPCVVRDVLGGSWDDAAERWTILDQAIEAWTPLHNPFPTLPSHPQRVVGWATLALDTPDLATSREYAGHARLHVDISIRAATSCDQ